MNYDIEVSDDGKITIDTQDVLEAEIFASQIRKLYLAMGKIKTKAEEPPIGAPTEDGWFHFKDKNGNSFYLAPRDAPEKMDWQEGKDYASALSKKFNREVFVPSIDQLEIVGNFVRENPDSKLVKTLDLNARYWSSSESSNNGAWNQQFSDGDQNNLIKSLTYAVRCARR